MPSACKWVSFIEKSRIWISSAAYKFTTFSCVLTTGKNLRKLKNPQLCLDMAEK